MKQKKKGLTCLGWVWVEVADADRGRILWGSSDSARVEKVKYGGDAKRKGNRGCFDLMDKD